MEWKAAKYLPSEEEECLKDKIQLINTIQPRISKFSQSNLESGEHKHIETNQISL